MIKGDADRCLTDISIIPIKVSLREIIVLGLATRMEITDASFNNKSLSIQGLAGTVTSSQHPVLGALVHFTLRNVNKVNIPRLRIKDRDISKF
jgi:hypothetical protein